MTIFKIIGAILVIPVLLVLLIALGLMGGLGALLIYFSDFIGIAFTIFLIVLIGKKIIKIFKK